MSGWGSGYVTDVDYTFGYYALQSPAHLAAACLLVSEHTDIPAAFDELHYLELGCGNGLTAMTFAAANPGWRITGVDFNPAHIAVAREFAQAAGLDNVTFLEGDLATMAEEPLAGEIPPAHVVSMHGVWSWVLPPVRAGILRLLRDKVLPGGVVHLSYNALPGWQAAMGMQRLVYEAGRHTSGRADRQVGEGIAFARELAAAGALHLQTPFAQELLERFDTVPNAYLTHEYMNAGWAPCFHSDVAAAMSEAKLDWVGSARMLDNFDALLLTAEQRAVAEKIDDPLICELVKDLCRAQGLRHDIYVRGHRRMQAEARNRALAGLTVALTTPPARFAYEIRLPAGTATLNRAFYERMLMELARGPRSIGELLALPGLEGETDNPGEQLGMFVGTSQGVLLPRPGALQSERAHRFNTVVAERLGGPDRLNRALVAASPRLGAGIAITALELAVLNRMTAGVMPDPAAWAVEIGGTLTEEARRSLTTTIGEILDARVPAWQHVGLM